MAWRAADSLALREFLGLKLSESPPDHSTISRTRRLIDVETHEAVFSWVLKQLAESGLLKGKTIGIDATMRRWCMNRNWPATNPTHRSITYQERTTMAYRARPSG